MLLSKRQCLSSSYKDNCHLSFAFLILTKVKCSDINKKKLAIKNYDPLQYPEFKVTFLFLEDNTQPCAKIHTSSSVVPLGSPLTATCVIREDCPLGQAVHIEWRLGNRFIPSSAVANESDRVSQAVISSFNHTRALLTCSIQASDQVVAGVEIRAGCEKVLLRVC